MRREDVAADIGERIRELREHLGETQEVFAEHFARGWKQISSWERGAQRPPPKVLERAAKSSGWPVEIFQKDGPRPASVIPAGYREPRGVMVVAEGTRRYEVPGGLPVRQVIDQLDLSTVPPEDVKAFASFEIADLEQRRQPMELKRILWWIDQAFAAGQRAVRGAQGGQRGAEGAGSL